MKATELLAGTLCTIDAFTWTAIGHLGIGLCWMAGLGVVLALNRWRG